MVMGGKRKARTLREFEEGVAEVLEVAKRGPFGSSTFADFAGPIPEAPPKPTAKPAAKAEPRPAPPKQVGSGSKDLEPDIPAPQQAKRTKVTEADVAKMGYERTAAPIPQPRIDVSVASRRLGALESELRTLKAQQARQFDRLLEQVHLAQQAIRETDSPDLPAAFSPEFQGYLGEERRRRNRVRNEFGGFFDEE